MQICRQQTFSRLEEQLVNAIVNYLNPFRPYTSTSHSDADIRNYFQLNTVTTHDGFSPVIVTFSDAEVTRTTKTKTDPLCPAERRVATLQREHFNLLHECQRDREKKRGKRESIGLAKSLTYWPY